MRGLFVHMHVHRCVRAHICVGTCLNVCVCRESTAKERQGSHGNGINELIWVFR